MRLVGAGLTLALCASSANADIIIGNLGDVSGGGTAFGGGGVTTVFKAAGFTMGAQAYTLDSVTLTIQNAVAGATPDMQIWSGVGAPSALVYDMPDFVLPDVLAPTDFTWIPAASVQLQAGTTYWVYMDNSALGASWAWDSGSTAPTGIAVNAGFNFNGGASSFMNTYQVNGSVPAPAVLAALGVAGLISGRRRRRCT